MLAFKIAGDPYVGKLAYVRCYSGTMKAGDRVIVAGSGRKERINRIVRMHANKREELQEIRAGEDRRPRGSQVREDGATPPLPSRESLPPRAGRLPRAGDLRGHRAHELGRERQARRDVAASLRGRSLPHHLHPRGHRGSASSRAWASFISRSRWSA